MDLNTTFAEESSSMLASNNETSSSSVILTTESSYGGPAVSNITLTSMIGDEGGKITSEQLLRP